MLSTEQFISLLRSFKKFRHGSRGFPTFSEHDYLRMILSFVSAKFQCSCWFGGSLALYLQGQKSEWGDIDVITDRMFAVSDLPWTVDCHGFNMMSKRLNLDIFFSKNEKHIPFLELSKRHVVEVNGLRMTDADFVQAVNWCWRKDEKQRQMIKPAWSVAELEAALYVY